MELKSFKELLLKKVSGNPYLETLIKFAKDELIADEVIESLLKMAEPSAAMGRGANSAITAYAGQMDNSDIEQLRDALAHHISHYKSALKHGNRDVADKHLEKIIPMMHLAGRAARHTGGKLALDYVSTTPWESNYTTTARHPDTGKLIEGTKDLGRRPRKSRYGDIESGQRTLEHRGVPDYRYLEMAPHAEHGETSRMPHKGGYPFEEIQLGSPSKKDAGQAYLPIEDIPDTKTFTPHPFDSHPIHAVADNPEHKMSPEEKESFITALAGWKASDPHKQWIATQKQKFQANPEAYKTRGHAKPSHHFEGLKLLDQPGHAKGTKAEAVSEGAPAAPTQAAAPAINTKALPAGLKAKFGIKD